MSIVYSVVNQKGGVGKTTTTVSLGTALATRGYRTLIIDADEVLIPAKGFRMPALTADAYQTVHEAGESGTTFYLTQIVKSALPWRYVGVLHEVIQCDAPHTTEKLEGLVCKGFFDSARNVDPKVQALVQQIGAIEVTVTHSETDALLLEYNLIKAHKPRFNVVLRDDKSFPYIHLATNHEFPRLAFHRDHRAGAADLGDRHVLLHVCDRLHHQHDDADGAVAGHRHPDRRCGGGAREHLPAHGAR